jgi:MFS family permease
MKEYLRNMSFTSPRDLRLVISAKAVSFFGDEVATFALVLRLQAHGASAAEVAALLMANMAPILLLAGPAGRAVDRFDNRRLLLVSSLLQAVVCGSLMLVSAPVALLGLVAVLGAGQAVNGAAWQALLPALAGPGELPRAVSRSQAANTVAGIAGPALSGLVTGWLGVGAALAVDAGTFLLVAVAAMLLRVGRVGITQGGERMEGGLAIVRRTPLLRSVIGSLGLLILLGGAVNVVEVFLVRETLGASAAWFGICAAGYSIGLLAGAVLAGRIGTTRGQARGIAVAAPALSIGLCAMGLSPNVGFLLFLGALAGVGNGVLNVTAGALVMGSATPAERGRVAALLGGVVSGCMLASYAVGGAVAAALSPREVFVVAGLLGTAGTLLAGRTVLRAATAHDRANGAHQVPDVEPVAA